MLVAYQARARAVFIFGFAKNARDNLDPDELFAMRAFTKDWLAADAERIELALTVGELEEIL